MAAAAVAILRMVCVPVGSFRTGLEELRWGMSQAEVTDVLGEPNRICGSAEIDHVPLSRPDSAAVRRALAENTSGRWVYTRREPRRPIPRETGPGCRAPSIATEIGFDVDGRLRWIVREMDQTPLELDPATLAGP